MRLRFRCFVGLKTFFGHAYGANSQYFNNAHTSGSPRQKTIVSAASTRVPEMLNSVVVSRRANTGFISSRPARKSRAALSLKGPAYMEHLACQEGAASCWDKWLTRRNLEPSQRVFGARRVRGSNQMSKVRQCTPTRTGSHVGLGKRVGDDYRGPPDALVYSDLNNSLSGYCSVNSRNNLCARASCFSRRAARARTILANGLR